MTPEDCYQAVYLFEHFSPEESPYPCFTAPGESTYISEPEWAALVHRSQLSRSRTLNRVRWLSNGWFTSMLRCGYTLTETPCDYLVFAGCSLLLTTGEWLLGEASTAQWVVGLTASVPLTQFLPLWWEPARDIFAAMPHTPAAGATSMYLQPQFAANLAERCDPAELQMAYRISWDKGPTAIREMSRGQIADVMVDIQICKLELQPIPSAFGVNERPMTSNDLVQKLGELQSSQLLATRENVLAEYRCQRRSNK